MPTSRRDAESPRLRVGIFIALLPPDGHGGAEYQAERLAQELAQRGHQVHVFARRVSRRADRQRSGFRIHRRPVLPVPGLRLLGEIAFGVTQALRVRPQVFLCYLTLNSGLLGWIASRLGRIPFVIWTRCDIEVRYRDDRWRGRLSAFLHRRAHAVWVQSASIRDLLRQELAATGRAAEWKALEPRVRVLGNAVDVPDAAPEAAPPAGRRFVFIGRLAPAKNLAFVLDALRELPGVELDVVGTGPLRAELEAAAHGLPVRFLGAVPHDRIPAVLQASRALVLCSREEGVPNVVLEALANGRPAIVTPIGAMPELIHDRVNGRVVPLDDVQALRQAFVDLCDDAAWAAMASNARRAAQAHAWPALVQRVESELTALSRTPSERRR